MLKATDLIYAPNENMNIFLYSCVLYIEKYCFSVALTYYQNYFCSSCLKQVRVRHQVLCKTETEQFKISFTLYYLNILFLELRQCVHSDNAILLMLSADLLK